jgi:hypothetical protein
MIILVLLPTFSQQGFLQLLPPLKSTSYAEIDRGTTVDLAINQARRYCLSAPGQF